VVRRKETKEKEQLCRHEENNDGERNNGKKVRVPYKSRGLGRRQTVGKQNKTSRKNKQIKKNKKKIV
jgi:hypothetical protein